MAQLRDDLMFTAVRSEKLKELQDGLMNAGSPVNARNERDVSLLHLAATAPNPAGVDMLLYNRASPRVRDREGQTPLHCAIRMFCEEAAKEKTPARDATKGLLEDVIRQLLGFTMKSELNNSRDASGMTPGDIIHDDKERCPCFPKACSHNPIRALLNGHQPIAGRRLRGHRDEPWKGWNPPGESGLDRKACVSSKAILAEFYKEKENRTDEWPGYYVPSVLELIYQRELGPAKILSKMAERRAGQKREVCCRWIHVPANNVSVPGSRNLYLAV
jgi:hypothetical protein